MSVDTLPVSEATRRQLDFLVASHALTGVDRLNRLVDGSRAESSAEHSWHLAVTAIALAGEYAPDVTLGRVLTMLAIHDCVFCPSLVPRSERATGLNPMASLVAA